MLPTVWNLEAIEDAERVIDYIRQHDPAAAQRVRDRLAEVAANLGQHPYAYRQGRVPGTREAVALPNYILIYKVEIDLIRVVQVLHASQSIRPNETLHHPAVALCPQVPHRGARGEPDRPDRGDHRRSLWQCA